MRIESGLQNNYTQLSSGKRINSAKDDAAGLAIAQKLMSQVNGLDTAIDNGDSMNNLAKTAEGALGSIQDSLQRMRELAVQASNGTLAMEDKQSIQAEIEELKGSIGDVAKNTQFNTQKVLDGTFVNKNIAINPQGTGMSMTIQDTSLASLGIDTFDVTGSFDISTIDNALEKVSDARSDLGATSNAIMYANNANQTAMSNQLAAQSRIEDMDMADGATQLSSNQLLSQVKNYALKMTMKQNENKLNLLG